MAASRREDSIEQERRRWARELHDETLQELGGLSLSLETAAAAPGEEALRVAVDRALEHTRRSIESVHALIHELRPPALDQLGLEAALEVLVDRAEGAEHVQLACRFGEEGEGIATGRLSEEVETGVYRLVQEAVNNAIKHAGADRIEICLDVKGGTLCVCVNDNGVGFDPEDAPPGFGLTGMRERVGLLGGTVEIESEQGQGTTVRAELPLDEAVSDRSDRGRAQSGPGPRGS